MGRKRSRSSSRSRSRSQSRRHRRSSSSDSGSHRHSRSSGHKSKKWSRARSRSRDRYSHSRSRSRSRERRSRRSRSRERRRRSHSRSRDRERRRRSRSVERRSRKKHRSRSRSNSRTRRRRHSRSSSYDSHESSRRRKPSSRDKSPSRGALSTEEKSCQSSMASLSSEIPGYSNMTPAERVRAKLKMMLDKTSDKLNKESSSEEQATMMFAPPSAADIAKIEGDSFEPASFVSHRATKKDVRSGVGEAKKHYDVTSVDPSEYEPQVVELSDQLIQDTSPDEDDERKQREIHQKEREQRSSDVPKDEDSRKDSSSAVTNKNARWLSKLQKLRQQFTTPPTD